MADYNNYSNPQEDDMSCAVKMLSEELEGVQAYTKLSMEATDPDLKRMLESIIVDEKKHALHLLQWIQNHAQRILS